VIFNYLTRQRVRYRTVQLVFCT